MIPRIARNLATGSWLPWIVLAASCASESQSSASSSKTAQAIDAAAKEENARAEADMADCGVRMNLKLCCGNPGERPGGNCVMDDAFITPACTPGADMFDARIRGAACCSPFKPVFAQVPNGSGGCRPLGAQSTVVCIQCGDGTCGKAESACNCPEDCK